MFVARLAWILHVEHVYGGVVEIMFVGIQRGVGREGAPVAVERRVMLLQEGVRGRLKQVGTQIRLGAQVLRLIVDIEQWRHIGRRVHLQRVRRIHDRIVAHMTRCGSE